MEFKGKDLDSVYRDAAFWLSANAPVVTARGLATKEAMCAQLHILDPRARVLESPARAMSMRYLIGELCFYLDGRRDLKSIAHYAKFWERVSDDGETVNSAYGYRLFEYGRYRSQFEYALWCLEKDMHTRKAVMMIYHPADAKESKDNPCTVGLQLLVRDMKLHLVVTMRSQDFWLGVPYDVAFFALVQEMMWVYLRKTYPGLKLGEYYHNVGSLHVYEKNWEDIKGAARGKHESTCMPMLTDVDVFNWFDDLLTYEKSKRGVVLYKSESRRTAFQDWAKLYL